MERYLERDLFRALPDSLIYVERRLNNGALRRGIVGQIDLEDYDYNPGASTLIRATERTVLSRIPPRVAVRRGAALELPHVMLLVDDPDCSTIEPLTAETDQMEEIYDFDLMEQGGHITGYLMGEEQMFEVASAPEPRWPIRASLSAVMTQRENPPALCRGRRKPLPCLRQGQL